MSNSATPSGGGRRSTSKMKPATLSAQISAYNPINVATVRSFMLRLASVDAHAR